MASAAGSGCRARVAPRCVTRDSGGLTDIRSRTAGSGTAQAPASRRRDLRKCCHPGAVMTIPIVTARRKVAFSCLRLVSPESGREQEIRGRPAGEPAWARMEPEARVRAQRSVFQWRPGPSPEVLKCDRADCQRAILNCPARAASLLCRAIGPLGIPLMDSKMEIPTETPIVPRAGGIGEAYRARDNRLDRTVAVTVVAGDLATEADLRSCFEREARARSVVLHWPALFTNRWTDE